MFCFLQRVLVPWEKIAHDWHGRPHVFEEEACHLISELLDYSPDPKTLLLALPPSNLSYVLQCGVSNRCRLTEKVCREHLLSAFPAQQ